MSSTHSEYIRPDGWSPSDATSSGSSAARREIAMLSMKPVPALSARTRAALLNMSISPVISARGAAAANGVTLQVGGHDRGCEVESVPAGGSDHFRFGGRPALNSQFSHELGRPVFELSYPFTNGVRITEGQYPNQCRGG